MSWFRNGLSLGTRLGLPFGLSRTSKIIVNRRTSRIIVKSFGEDAFELCPLAEDNVSKLNLALRSLDPSFSRGRARSDPPGQCSS